MSSFRSRLGHVLSGVSIAALLSIASTAAVARTVETAHGAIDVPDQPKRVVVLTETALDTALAVGVKPLGSPITRGGTGVAEYLKAPAGQLTMVGTVREVNLESVLQLQPDLILAGPDLRASMYEKLRLMAPTVVPATTSFDDWKKAVGIYAHALGKQDALNAYLAKIDERADALKAKVKEGQIASVARWNPQGPIVMSSHLFVGQMLQAVGFKPTALAESLTKKPHSDTLSLENLSQADGDWLFLATLNPDGAKALDQTRKQPAFERLNAVRNGHVVSVDGQVWSSGSGPLAAEKVLSDLEKAVTD